MRRFFNLGQRIDLYLASRGMCQSCGRQLERGWHADHIIPHSKGGATEVENGQALCPDCNYNKGAFVADRIELRPFQQRFAAVVQSMPSRRQQILMANVYCGSGKTIAYLHGANILYRQGLIDAVAIFTPRLNLCRQVEQDWAKIRPLYDGPAMGRVEHRNNDPPLLRRGADGVLSFGYSATYGSLVSASKLHLDFLKEHRTLVVLDEAQQLGVDLHDGEDTTQSATIVSLMNEFAPYIFEVTGTPDRADGQRLINGVYSDLDPDTRMRYLQADVEATYIEGVSLGYLRPFDFELCDGQGIYEYLDGTTEELIVSDMRSGLYKMLEHQGYWQPIVDTCVRKVRDVQAIDKRFCGLIAAVDQKQAAHVRDYLKREYADLRVLLAISKDGKDALDNLELFKKAGHYDILITVRMAYVGYDHKWITVIAMLSAFREYGFLDQLFGRGERMLPDATVPRDLQALWAVVPDDPQMKAYVKQKRELSRRGLLERLKKPGPPPPPPRMGWTAEAQQTWRRAQGFDPAGDLSPTELAIMQKVQRKTDLASTPITKLAAVARFFGVDISTYAQADEEKAAPDDEPAPPNAQDTEKDLRNKLDRACKRCDNLIRNNGRPGIEYGWTADQCNKAFPPYKRFKECGMAELTARRKWVADFEAKLRGGSAAHV